MAYITLHDMFGYPVILESKSIKDVSLSILRNLTKIYANGAVYFVKEPPHIINRKIEEASSGRGS